MFKNQLIVLTFCLLAQSYKMKYDEIDEEGGFFENSIDVTESQNLYEVNQDLKISDSFLFDSMNFALKFQLKKDKTTQHVFCYAKIIYNSPTAKTIAYLENKKKQNNTLRKDDLVFMIKKGENVFFKFSVYSFLPIDKVEENKTKCNELKKKYDTNSFISIREFIDSHKNDENFLAMGYKEQYVLKFYKYPFARYSPPKINKLLKQKNSHEKIVNELNLMKTGSFNQSTNEFFIQSRIDQFDQEIQVWYSELLKFCKTNQLDEGKYYIILKFFMHRDILQIILMLFYKNGFI